MKKKVLLFDFDGTLFDTREDIAYAVNEARRGFGLEILTQEKVISFVGNGVGNLVEKTFADEKIPFEEAKDAVMRQYRSNPVGRSTPYPGVKELLPELSRTLVIVSNKPKEIMVEILKAHRTESWFAEIIGGECLEKRKPDPMAVEIVKQRLRCRNEEMIMIGDHAPDIEMANNAGIDSVFCEYGFTGEDIVGATHRISSFSEILHYI